MKDRNGQECKKNDPVILTVGSALFTGFIEKISKTTCTVIDCQGYMHKQVRSKQIMLK